MTIYSLFIFGKQPKSSKEKAVCLYSCLWNKARVADKPEEEEQLICGFLVSLKSFCQKISPTPGCQGVISYNTDKYKLTYLAAPTGVQFVLLSDPNTADLRDVLRQIYSRFFVEYLMKDPLYKLSTPITCELFVKNVADFVQSLPYF